MTAADVRDFFDRYARSRTDGDVEALAAQYPDAFTFAGPAGARIAHKAAFVASFPQGRAFLQSHGHVSTTTLGVEETTLDEHYLMARVRFLWRFEKAPAAPIDVAVDSMFILRVDPGALTIVFQQEREDFQDALRSRGVLPPIAIS
jgi:hypothetical protein